MLVAPRVQRGRRVVRAFPGVGWGVGVCWDPSREAPAAAAASGACCRFGLRGRPVSPRGRGGGEPESPPRHKGLSAGVELQARAAQLGGKGKDAGPLEVGKGAAAAPLPAPWRRRGCARVGRAEEGEEQPSRGARAETKMGATSFWRVTPMSVGLEQRWKHCGKP